MPYVGAVDVYFMANIYLWSLVRISVHLFFHLFHFPYMRLPTASFMSITHSSIVWSAWPDCAYLGNFKAVPVKRLNIAVDGGSHCKIILNSEISVV